MQVTAGAAEARGIGRALLERSVSGTSDLAVPGGASGAGLTQAATHHGAAAKALSLQPAGSGRSLMGQ